MCVSFIKCQRYDEENVNQARPARKAKTPKRLRPSIKLDVVNPVDFLKYKMPFACEDCSHFDEPNAKCTLEYNSAPHRRERQIRTYLLNGRMAFCRFMEID
jgi:hypothetical protein